MKSMLKAMALLGMISGWVVISHAATPQETYYQGQASLSGTTILGSTASTTSNGNFTLTVTTPPAINSGGGTYQGRNCFTRFVVQIPTTTVLTIADINTTKWTINGLGLGASGVNTLVLPEDHLGPWCTAVGDQTLFTLTNTNGVSTNPCVLDVEGYTTYGGTLNSGPMY